MQYTTMGKSYAEGVRSMDGGGRKCKICGVCGDRAKSFHFGGISCDSCKAFFRRSVQGEGFRAFRCAFLGRCDITMANRKCCQHCRFNKCLNIGMETNWVMSEEERVHFMHNRMSTRHFYHRLTGSQRLKVNNENIFPIGERNVMSHLTLGETQEIEVIVGLFNRHFLPEVWQLEPEAVLVNEFVSWVQKLVKFARQIPRFTGLTNGVQVALLRANIFEMFVVVHVISRVAGSGRFSRESECYLCSQTATMSVTLRNSVTDTPTLVLLLMIILFSSDSLPLPVDDQLHYCYLLEKYIRVQSANHSKGSSSFLLAKLLLLLPTLREIRDKHMSHPVHFGSHF